MLFCMYSTVWTSKTVDNGCFSGIALPIERQQYVHSTRSSVCKCCLFPSLLAFAARSEILYEEFTDSAGAMLLEILPVLIQHGRWTSLYIVKPDTVMSPRPIGSA